ncbi:hypothetical protein [Mangrovibacterium diazotrophicum]|uniref:Tetratricopeptide repeat protein n=1 Tax=Mangrovibacterium diazotrophicum TaxID=1261403 RepID=A0A419W807_9BACT|nr:hypothetical protein [Mangrovibacterium diazotrophicum]RKD91560.1 hypothetical protein BC643_1916 [Mangrovibacterium diazotrophicum]
MKKLIISSVLLLMCVIAMAQKPAYMQAMGKTLSQYATAHSPADFQQIANKFAVIAKAEPEEWLPVYYEAQSYILMSFTESEPAKKDPYLDEAEKLVNQLIEMVPEESEVYALQSFYYTGRLVVNPMERSQKYGPLSGQANGKALSLDPKNPRARYLNVQMEIGRARFMGGDVSAYCDQAKQLLADWDSYKPKSPIHPNWGKEQVVGLVKSCE